MASSTTTTTADPLPSQMKAQHLTAFNTPYSLSTVPVPKPQDPNDILIRVSAASYCHTDFVLASGQMPPNPSSFPHVGCHEFSGVVVSVPPNSTSPFKPGDRLGVPGRSFHPCGECFECKREPNEKEDPYVDGGGYSVYCADTTNNGISGPGGFREFAVVDWRQCAPVPEGMGMVEAATMMCAGITIYAAITKCGLERGQRVGIMGAGGGLGHLGLQFASAMGLRVTGVDAADKPLALARDIAEGKGKGRVRVVDARAEEAKGVREQMGREDGKEDFGDMGLDAVIILPESQRAFDYGIGLLRNHGKCVLVSFPADGFHLNAWDVVFRDISIVGSLVGSNKLLRETLRFAAEHGVRAKTKTFPLSKLNELVEEYHKGDGGKLVVDMTLSD
ncbi:chaperonin 10-like protein [Coniochaeta sp. 2T2.1]|nr:chaperonin 10-like protein [Coniochaeta sp. 2T2.1]